MQVPAQFQYARATSVDHALTLLARYGPQASVVAGGHSLLPMMKLRLAQPEALVDINDLTELTRIVVEEGELRVGALVRHAELLESAMVGKHFAIFHDAERVIADPIVRNRGTVGGSLCQADPSEDLSAAFAAVRARALIRGRDGERMVAVRDLFTGPYETDIDRTELLIELRIPARPLASSYQKVERRSGDWAIVAVGAGLAFDGDRIVEAGIGLTAVGATGAVAAEAEDFLRGGPATEERFAEAGRIAATTCEPVADQRDPAGYKRHLVAELTTRALRTARQRWLAEQPEGGCPCRPR